MTRWEAETLLCRYQTKDSCALRPLDASEQEKDVRSEEQTRKPYDMRMSGPSQPPLQDESRQGVRRGVTSH